MSSHLIAALHQEERAIIAELRASRPFMRLEGIRRLLEMYDAQPSVAISLDAAPLPAERTTAAVVQLAPQPTMATGAPVASSQAIPMPAPAEATAFAPPVTAGAPEEPVSVVSSVRAALLGIGKP